MINFITNKIKCWILTILGIGVCFAAPIGVDIDNKANPYEKIGTQFEIQLPEQARIAVSENKPELYLGKWDDECFIKVGLPTQSNNKVKRKLFTNKLEWQDGNNKVHMYPIEDGFEYEVIFDEKPISNIMELEIETQGLSFYYQPALTKEDNLEADYCVPTDCFKDGEVITHRPENVVGSFAVYHESKQGDYSQMGKKNYRAGKAFHIFRPRIIDNAGIEVWGKLNITDNLLTVEIPQSFLDTAVYPIRHAAGLTFGCDPASPGGTSQSYYTPNNRLMGSVFTMGASAGTADSISVYHTDSWSSGVSAKTAIYLHSNSAKQFESEELGTMPDDFDWQTFTVSGSPSLTASTEYVICSWSNAGYGLIKYDDGVGTTQGHYEEQNYNGWPATASFTHEDKKFSIYCTYTAGGGAARRIIITQ